MSCRRFRWGRAWLWTMVVSAALPCAAQTAIDEAGAFPPLPADAEARRLLPPTERDRGQPLPAWARALARPLPRTTAAMLELDLLHRARTPLDPLLAGKLRFATARANRCAYAEAYALADLAREGLDSAALDRLKSGKWQDDAQADELEFATRMALSAHAVSDAEVAALLKKHGETQLVGIVLALAYANFHQRLVQTLGVTVEEGGPLAPVDIRFEPLESEAKLEVPPRAPPMPAPTDVPTDLSPDGQWQALELGDLQSEKARQQERLSRVRVPKWENVRAFLAPDRAGGPPIRVVWTLVCTGYQPAMARAWGACTQAFAQDSRQDRVFEETLFWVHTRALECFY